MAYLGKTPSQAVRQRYIFTQASAGATSISGADDSGNTLTFTDGGYVDVYLNGVLLVAGTDYNTTTANTIGGLSALSASDVVEIVVYDTFAVFGGDVQGNLTISNGDFTVDTDTLYVDATNDRVGINISSPAYPFDVRTTGETEQVVANFSSDGNSGDRQRLEIYCDPSTQTTELYGGAGGGSDNSTNLAFSTRQGASGRVEAMRIDSLGNFIVGKTGTSATTDGFVVYGQSSAKGATLITRDDNRVLLLNRRTSDGEILEFRKDNTSVGTISATSGSMSINTGSAGGIYLGGTDAANYLDNYEEGTFTPSLEFGTSVAYTSRTGAYTKIGRMVMFRFNIIVSSHSNSDASSIHIRMPFLADGNEPVMLSIDQRNSSLVLHSNSGNTIGVGGALTNSRDFLIPAADSTDYLKYNDCNSSGTIKGAGIFFTAT